MDFTSTIPVSGADLLAFDYSAVSKERSKGIVIVDTFQSLIHSGFVHYGITDVLAGVETYSKRPIKAGMVGWVLDNSLNSLGTNCESFLWQASPSRPRDRDGLNQPRVSREFVYFLVAGPFVKIGKTTGVPGSRISELQTGCPYEITLAAHIDGGLKKEAELHRQFSEYRVRENGEWFKHSGALKSFITSISKAIT